MILVQPENVKYAPEGVTLLITDSPRNQVVKILDFIYAEPRKHGISYDSVIASGVYFRKKKSVYIAPFTVIEKGAVIEENVQIMSGAYIGRNCVIGKNTIVYQNAVIQNATIGEDCVIYSGASIGKDGFGYTRQEGKNVFIQHAGRVIIGNRVSIGANTCVDRGALTDTKIGDGTKLDNLVQVAHGVVIGKECFAASGVGIAGMAVIEDGAMLGGHVGVANKVRVGANAEIGAQSGLMRDVPAGEKWFGTPAFPAMESLRMTAWLNRQVKGKKNG
jgi:UDP-3-O-[3-hydroxymyristoyl] glucosamine N-acyltransferase